MATRSMGSYSFVIPEPDPATNYIYLLQPAGVSYQLASVINTAGQTVQPGVVLSAGGTVRVDLAAGLPTGIYFVRFTGAGASPLTVEVLKTP